MDVAFGEACLAAKAGEAPIGASLFAPDGTLIASAHNGPIGLNDPTGHAEILCLRKAGVAVGNYRLTAARDERAVALVSNLEGCAMPFTNHRLWTVEGVMGQECSALLKRFFLERRK